jgi:hypothetical protein
MMSAESRGTDERRNRARTLPIDELKQTEQNTRIMTLNAARQLPPPNNQG